MIKKKVWHHFSDLTLMRMEVHGKQVINVLDADGCHAFDLPASLSDEEAKAVIAVINRGYETGFMCGERSRSREFRKLLTDGEE
jgi:hypothetical protein